MGFWLRMGCVGVLVAAVAGCNDGDGGDGLAEAGPVAPATIALEQVGRYTTGVFDEGAAEIVAYDALNQRLFVINANASTVDVLSIADPAVPQLLGTIDATSLGAKANSVAVADGIVAVAIEADNKQAPGVVAFYNAGDLSLLDSVAVGALPDMVTFTHDGNRVLVANEGEPSDDYSTDPEGTVSVIDLSAGVTSATVMTLDFQAFNADAALLAAAGVRIFGPAASVAQDLEPEYIAVSADDTRAWVTLQENNAIAVIDLEALAVTGIRPLGFKDHGLRENAFDASDEDGVDIATAPVRGLYLPDAIAAFSMDGVDYYITANEGDARDYAAFSEEAVVADLALDPVAFPNAAALQMPEALGDLTVTDTLGDTDNDGDYDALYAFGARSFAIWRAGDGVLVADSGSDFEDVTARRYGDQYNNDNTENNGDSRSDNKGPEPEAVDVGEVDGRLYAFIGLERMGGIMVYDITDPSTPEFVEYVSNRDLSRDPATQDAGDLGPEGMVFIPAEDSPVGAPLLAVGNEVSGSTTIYRVNRE